MEKDTKHYIELIQKDTTNMTTTEYGLYLDEITKERTKRDLNKTQIKEKDTYKVLSSTDKSLKDYIPDEIKDRIISDIELISIDDPSQVNLNKFSITFPVDFLYNELFPKNPKELLDFKFCHNIGKEDSDEIDFKLPDDVKKTTVFDWMENWNKTFQNENEKPYFNKKFKQDIIINEIVLNFSEIDNIIFNILENPDKWIRFESKYINDVEYKNKMPIVIKDRINMNLFFHVWGRLNFEFPDKNFQYNEYKEIRLSTKGA